MLRPLFPVSCLPMMSGILSKMKTHLQAGVAHYDFILGDKSISLGDCLGQKISLQFENIITCVNCHNKIKKNYGNGYCKQCFVSLPECDLCIVKPELCHYHKGTCRDASWGEKYCMTPHVVYLANSSEIKVGITRQSHIPTRWIDQGAIQGLPLLRVSSRLQSGLFETLLAEVIPDKTNWRNMLKGDIPELDLKEARERVLAHCGEGLEELEEELGEEQIEYLDDADVVSISYPVRQYPEKVKSLTFEQTPLIKGTLWGIKGQYLILDTGVFNVRRASGYQITLNF